MLELLLMPISKPDSNKLNDVYEVARDIEAVYKGVTVRVPKLFQFDGASIPPLAWQLIGSPFHPRLMIASVFHDWLYHTHQFEDREDADAMFHVLLRQSRVGKVQASLMHAAVRTFGGAYYENDSDDMAYIKRLTQKIIQDSRDPANYGLS